MSQPRYMLVDETSGIKAVESKVQSPESKVRIVEGIIVGSIFGVGFTLLVISLITLIRFHYLP